MTYDYIEWLKNSIKIFCKCGCNQEIIIKSHHKYYGIPEYIKGHGSFDKHPSEETRQKMKEVKIGENNPNFHKPRSKEIKKKISNGERGKIISEEIKQKIRIANLGKSFSPETQFKKNQIPHNKGKSPSKETKQKMKEAKINYIPWNKGLTCPQLSGENSYSWKGGKSFEPYCPKFNNRKKEEIRNQYNRKCYICGKDEKENITKTNRQLKLCIHHLDMDKEQRCNGKSWKLIPLCLSCHGKIHNEKIKVLNHVN